MTNWKRDAGRKTAAVSPALRVLMLVFPLRPPDEKLLPAATSSACDSYSGEGVAQVTVEPRENILHLTDYIIFVS